MNNEYTDEEREGMHDKANELSDAIGQFLLDKKAEFMPVCWALIYLLVDAGLGEPECGIDKLMEAGLLQLRKGLKEQNNPDATRH